MMKRDFQKYKFVGGDKVENKAYTSRLNQAQGYRQKDINDERLPKWELIQKFSDRDDINSKHHQQSNSASTKFRPARKNFGQQSNQHQAQTHQDSFKPCIRMVEQEVPKSARDLTPRVRRIPEISEELKIINEMAMFLPHMRSITPKGRPVNVKHISEFKNSEELDIINQMHSELPHMRTKTPNSRPIKVVTHTLSNETDFINQKKHLLPSMQNIQPQVRQCLTARNQSQFTLAWDA